MPDNLPWRITFYKDRRGKIPALDFINSLPKWEQAKVYNSKQTELPSLR
jgi:hypothetical protein